MRLPAYASAFAISFARGTFRGDGFTLSGTGSGSGMGVGSGLRTSVPGFSGAGGSDDVLPSSRFPVSRPVRPDPPTTTATGVSGRSPGFDDPRSGRGASARPCGEDGPAIVPRFGDRA